MKTGIFLLMRGPGKAILNSRRSRNPDPFQCANAAMAAKIGQDGGSHSQLGFLPGQSLLNP